MYKNFIRYSQALLNSGKVQSLSVKPLSETRWECWVASVKEKHYQTSDIKDASLEVAGDCSDPEN